MEELKIMVLEDDTNIGLQLEKFIQQIGYTVTGVATNGEDCIKMAKSNPPDLLIADIDLGEGPNGIEVAEHLFKKHKIPTIFITGNATKENVRLAHKQLKTISFLSKPFRQKDLENSIESAIISIEELQEQEALEIEVFSDRIFVKKDNLYHKVMLDEILWLEADGAYSKLFTERDNFMYSVNLNKLYKRIGDEKLLRVHNKFIVNPEKVDKINTDTVFIGDKKITIGRSYNAAVKQKFKTI